MLAAANAVQAAAEAQGTLDAMNNNNSLEMNCPEGFDEVSQFTSDARPLEVPESASLKRARAFGRGEDMEDLRQSPQLQQHSNTSSLESVDNACDDGDQLCSTSCSSSSFENLSRSRTMDNGDLHACSSSPSSTKTAAQLCTTVLSPTDSEATTTSGISSGTDSASTLSGPGTVHRRPQRANPFLTKVPLYVQPSTLSDMPAMPELDFDRLEKSLEQAAKEREAETRRLKCLSYAGNTAVPAQANNSGRTRRSNLATRLKSGMNLQVCFMNDIPTDDDDHEGSLVPKSKSTPNLKQSSRSRRVMPRVDTTDEDESDDDEASSDKNQTPPPPDPSRARPLPYQMQRAYTHHYGPDERCSASQLRRAATTVSETVEVRRRRLEREAQTMLRKAKEAALMQVELEKAQQQTVKSPIEDVIGFPVTRKHLTRSQLTRMNVTQLQIILNDFHSRIEVLNEELMKLLVDRDSMHMEQDSMLVDIEDLVQHQRAEELKLPDFLVIAPQPKSNQLAKGFARRIRVSKR